MERWEDRSRHEDRRNGKTEGEVEGREQTGGDMRTEEVGQMSRQENRGQRRRCKDLRSHLSTNRTLYTS